MPILERLTGHDAWTTRKLLTLSAMLSDADLDRDFDIGHRTLRRTFAHLVGNMECWCDLMAGRPQRHPAGSTPSNRIADLIERLDVVAEQLLWLCVEVTATCGEDAYFIDYLDDPPRRKPLGAGLVHVATHGMHHRAQCLYLMRRLGVPNLIEGDALSWEMNHLGLEEWPRDQNDNCEAAN